MNTLPPDRDLSPASRARQRAELTAIVDHESATRTYSRRLVPLAAAAAVVVVASAAVVVVPNLRDGRSQPAVSGSTGASSATKTSPWQIEPLSDAEKGELFSKCRPEMHPAKGEKVVDGFRFTNAPADAPATTWVVNWGAGLWYGCGFDKTGKFVTGNMAGTPGQPMYDVVEQGGMGSGLYMKSVARITVTPLNGEPVEALLRDGLYYAPVRKLEMNVDGPASTPLPYITRGYDAGGKLVYTGSATVGARTKARSKCYVDPDGKLDAWNGPKPTTTTSCLRMIAWDGRPSGH